MKRRPLPTAVIMIAPVLAILVLATPARGDTVPATVAVSGTQWGISTCFFGANEGQSDFNIADLQDAGVNAYRLWGTMERVEWEDDDGVYGSPSIAQIKSDPDIVNWDWWDDAMSDTPMPAFPIDLHTMLTDLRAADIEVVWVLRNRSADGQRPEWSPNPPTTEDDWNEWWEYVFAVAYWLNVRNDFQVDRFQALNEPNHGGQGWGGDEGEYFELVEVTKDALDHVYDTYLPGRSFELHAPVSAGAPAAWVQGALQQIPDAFTTVDVHSYAENIVPQVQQVHQWMSSTGNEDKEVWLSEWGSLQPGAYDQPSVVVRNVITNMRRMSFPDSQHVDGSLIFKMYDQPGGLEGLISASGTPRLAYYGFRMAARALNGCRPTFEVTTSNGSLLGIATQDQEGSTYLLMINASGTTNFEVDADLSALVTGGAGTMWQVDATHIDEIVADPILTNGHATFTLGSHTAVLLKFEADLHEAVADAYVRGGSFASTNLGTDTLLHLKHWPSDDNFTRWSYLTFDLNGMDPDSVAHVNLRIFGGMGGSPATTLDSAVYAVPNTGWSETGITWNNKPALDAQLDTMTVPVTCLYPANSCWHHLDVTNYVQSELAAERTVISLALKNLNNQNDSMIRIFSRENPANQPHLQVFSDDE